MLNAGWSSGVVGVEQFFFVSGMGNSVCVISHHSCTKCVPPSSPPGGGELSASPRPDSICQKRFRFGCTNVLWTVCFRCGCLGNECSEIAVLSKCVSKKHSRYKAMTWHVVPNNVLYAKRQIAQYLRQDYATILIEKSRLTSIHYWTPPSWFDVSRFSQNRFKFGKWDTLLTRRQFGQCSTMSPLALALVTCVCRSVSRRVGLAGRWVALLCCRGRCSNSSRSSVNYWRLYAVAWVMRSAPDLTSPSCDIAGAENLVSLTHRSPSKRLSNPDFASQFWLNKSEHWLIRELSTPHVDQSANLLTASWFIGELSGYCWSPDVIVAVLFLWSHEAPSPMLSHDRDMISDPHCSTNRSCERCLGPVDGAAVVCVASGALMRTNETTQWEGESELYFVSSCDIYIYIYIYIYSGGHLKATADRVLCSSLLIETPDEINPI